MKKWFNTVRIENAIFQESDLGLVEYVITNHMPGLKSASMKEELFYIASMKQKF